jgi:hypothetical protein
MGLPESGTQHATSPDFALPLHRTAEPDPLAADAPFGETPPPEQPHPPGYDDPTDPTDPTELVASSRPAYDEPTDLLDAIPDVEATELAATQEAVGTPAYDALAAEAGYTELAAPTVPPPGAGGVLAQVRAFADERPAAFLAAALVAGWLVGKLLGSSDDDEED